MTVYIIFQFSIHNLNSKYSCSKVQRISSIITHRVVTSQFTKSIRLQVQVRVTLNRNIYKSSPNKFGDIFNLRFEFTKILQVKPIRVNKKREINSLLPSSFTRFHTYHSKWRMNLNTKYTIETRNKKR
jgi:hypothetical protein